jgi:hypothetical protein
MSRVDIRIGADRIQALFENSEEFFQKLFSFGNKVDDAVTWEIPDETPANGKYLLEDATILQLSYSNTQAEMEFYALPTWDIYNALREQRNVEYRGPRPVVSITLTTSQLHWVMSQARDILSKNEVQNEQ